MSRSLTTFVWATTLSIICVFCSDVLHAATKHYVVSNDDVNGPNTLTFYLASGTSSATKLTRIKTIKTGGKGEGGGFFGIPRQALVANGGHECVFAADGATNDIAAAILETQTLVGRSKGSKTDINGQGGMGLIASSNGKYLYAGFSGSFTIATFKVGVGCSLSFMADVAAMGINSGIPHGMASRGDVLVLAYGDGSIESFNISGGVPVSNGDLQLSTGFNEDNVFPDGVDMTKDGHFAIFGDASGQFSEVEVSDLSSGKLSKTVKYGSPTHGLGQGLAANNVQLSPDETLLYVSDNLSGQVTAAYFNKTTGKLHYGCISKPLKGFETTWRFSSAIATESGFGTGSVLWVAEDPVGSGQSSVGAVEVTSKAGKCTLTESTKSPAIDANSKNLCWISAFPPRPF